MALILTIKQAAPIKHDITDYVFMYVKRDCPHTIPACHRLRRCKHLRILDIDSGRYLVFKNNELTPLKKAPLDLLKAYHFKTVPQVFTRDTEWYYIGDYEALIQTPEPSAPPVVDPDNIAEDELPVATAVPVVNAEPIDKLRF